MSASAFFYGDGAGTGAACALGVLLGLSVSVPVGAAGAGQETRPPVAKPGGPPRQAWFPKAPPLPAPRGRVIRVNTTEKLFRAAREVRPGGTILIADGHYMIPRCLAITTDEVTVRGASGDPDRVILDGAKSRHGELLGVTRASGVTIADLTIQNVRWNGFKLNADTGVHRVAIYNCVIHNVWQRGVKGVPGVVKEGRRIPCRGCRIQYCLFYNDRPKRLDDEPYEREHPERFGGNYIGGIDAMNAKGWVISDNVFIGIHGRTGEARGAIFLWNGSEDCVIERNVVIDCDTGICLGNSHRGREWKVHCTRFVVRNNFVTRTPEAGILAAYTRDSKILANTIHHPRNRLKRLIRVIHENPGLVVADNLLSGPPPRLHSRGPITFAHNYNAPDLSAFFRAPARGDLHLAKPLPGALDRAEPFPEVAEDIDREPRGERPDIGADEFISQPTRKDATPGAS